MVYYYNNLLLECGGLKLFVGKDMILLGFVLIKIVRKIILFIAKNFNSIFWFVFMCQQIMFVIFSNVKF